MRGFAADTAGATAIEYALLSMLVAAVIVASLTAIGSHVNSMIASAAAGFR